MNWGRVRRARTVARGMLWVGGFAVAIPVFLFIAAPRFTDPSFGPTLETPWFLYAIGFGGMLFGLGWMWRIYKAPTKVDSPRWRYRDRG